MENRAGVQVRVSYILLFLHLPLFKLLHIYNGIEQEQIKTRVRAALLKIKSTTYKLFFAIFLTTVLL